MHLIGLIDRIGCYETITRFRFHGFARNELVVECAKDTIVRYLFFYENPMMSAVAESSDFRS